MKVLTLLSFLMGFMFLGVFAEPEMDAKLANEEITIAKIAKLAAETAEDDAANSSFTSTSTHTNNWAVLVSTSRFWFNYRHMANVLSLYRTVKRLGIPDSQIILMLSDDIACNPRNAFPGTVFNNMDQAIDLYGDSIEVDYRGYEVTVENFIRLLTDRWDENHPRSKRLLTDENSNIFIYLTGHGGNEFLKFQDAEEISAYDIANAFEQMYEKKRYNEIFFMIDTCQANTMYKHFYSPNILSVGSSEIDESSYSHHSDMDVGVAVIDRFTYYTLEFLEKINKNSKVTMDKLFNEYTFENVHSNPGINTALYNRKVEETLLTDFFGNVQNVRVDDVEDDILQVVGQYQEGQLLQQAHEEAIELQKEENTDATDASSTSARDASSSSSYSERGFVFGNSDEEERKTLINISLFQTKLFGSITFAVLVALWMIGK